MSTETPVRPRPGASPVLEEALQRRNMLVRAQDSGWRAMVQLLVAVVALCDANHPLLVQLLPHSHLAASLLYLVEMAVFAILLSSSLSSLWTMLSPLHSNAPISLTSEQFRLLRLHPNSPGFTRSPDPKPKSPGSGLSSPLPGPLVSPDVSMTPVNMSRHSWLSQHSPASPASLSVTPPPGSQATNLRSGQFPHSPTSPLTDTSQLASYLASYSQWETSQSVLDQDTASQTSQAGAALLWQGAGISGGRGLDFSGSRPSLYQLSSPLPAALTSPGAPGGEAGEAGQEAAQSRVLSHRLGIDPLDLVSWNENLRVWLTQTILRPLVSEIDRVNSTLPRLGISDVSVGSVPVDRLRKVSALPQVSSNLSSLPTLLPYLEVSTDQTYLVARLRDLASTGAMSRYKWAAGGDNWSDRLPSDSEIVMHCLASYLDTRLLTTAGEAAAASGGPGHSCSAFTGRHFVKVGDKLRKEAGQEGQLALVQLSKSPAHYVVQVADKQLDVGGGRNNLIHSLLLFLHTVKVERAGMLGRVNFGLSGLNILWVLD